MLSNSQPSVTSWKAKRWDSVHGVIGDLFVQHMTTAFHVIFFQVMYQQVGSPSNEASTWKKPQTTQSDEQFRSLGYTLDPSTCPNLDQLQSL